MHVRTCRISSESFVRISYIALPLHANRVFLSLSLFLFYLSLSPSLRPSASVSVFVVVVGGIATFYSPPFPIPFSSGADSDAATS